MGLRPATVLLRFNGEPLLLFFTCTFCNGGEGNLTGGCLVASHEMTAVDWSNRASIPAGTLESPYRSNSARSRRSSSETKELAEPLRQLYGDVVEDVDERKSRFGQEGYAQVAEGLQMGKMGVSGERQKVEEVVDGGESVDFEGMLMGLAKGDRGDGVEDKDEIEMSLLLSSESMEGEAIAMAESGEEG